MDAETGNNPLFFLVDDDPYSARFLKQKLPDWPGLEIHSFQSAEDALDELAEASASESKRLPDVVLVDLKRNYRANEDFVLSAMPFVDDTGAALVVLAGHVDDELDFALKEAGVTSILDRRAGTSEIETRLKDVVSRQAANRSQTV